MSDACRIFVLILSYSNPAIYTLLASSRTRSATFTAAANMPEPLTVSLQPWPKPDKEKDSIGYLIQRINAQKGSFRNVSEQSLEEEIRLEKADKVVDEDEMEVEETTEEVADGESTREDLYKARAQIDQQLA